jgi:hypothetical protein
MGWVLLALDGGAGGKPMPVGDKMLFEAMLGVLDFTLAKPPQRIHEVVMSPAGGGWLVIGENGYIGSDFPDDAWQKLGQLAAASHQPRRLTFAPNGSWVIAGMNGGVAFAPGFPSDLQASVNAAIGHGQEVVSISIVPDGGWLLVTNNSWADEELDDPVVAASGTVPIAEPADTDFEPHHPLGKTSSSGSSSTTATRRSSPGTTTVTRRSPLTRPARLRPGTTTRRRPRSHRSRRRIRRTQA